MSRVGDLVEAVARGLVDHPDDVEVTETEQRHGIRVELRTADGDLGKLIGRQGRTASAIRTLASITAEDDGREVHVDFVDSHD